MISASDNARRRLEHDLHDGAQLRLTWLALRLRRRRRDRASASRQRAGSLLEEAESELQLAIDELRELAHGIHPAVLVDFGLAEAIKSLALRSSIPVELLELPAERLDASVETVGYYVVAEAIANAQKHSGASLRRGAGLGLERHACASRSPTTASAGRSSGPGSGLEGLRDRVEAVGGTMRARQPAGRRDARRGRHPRFRRLARLSSLRGDAAAARAAICCFGDARRPTSYRHHKTVVALVVIACVLAPIAGTAIWINNQVTKTDRYVRTVKPLASDPHIQAAIADNVTQDAVRERRRQPRGPSRCCRRARSSCAPAVANGLRTFVQNTTSASSPRTPSSGSGSSSTARAHKQLVKVLTGKGGTARADEERQGRDRPRPGAGARQAALARRGASTSSTRSRRARSGRTSSSSTPSSSKQGQRGVRLLKTLAIALPLLVLALIAAAIALSAAPAADAAPGVARDRRLDGRARRLAHDRPLGLPRPGRRPEPAARRGLGLLRRARPLPAPRRCASSPQSRWWSPPGAWLTGPYRGAVAIRRPFDSGLGWAQGEAGVATTPFGHWVGDNKRALRIGAILCRRRSSCSGTAPR